MDNKTLSAKDLKEFLDQKFEQYNTPAFVATDPIQVPHLYSRKEDIEIAAFLVASITWGKRSMIISSARKMMQQIGDHPYEFLMNASLDDLERVSGFQYRTFKQEDLLYFLRSLQNIYRRHNGLEAVFRDAYQQSGSIKEALIHFRQVFFELAALQRTQKHIANVQKQSAAKRLNMFLMWMCRQDGRGVHFGLWPEIKTADLYIPLDVHCGNTARKLGLLHRKQNDWKAVEELTKKLRSFDKHDPVKYDFALFGLGVFDAF